MVGLLVEHFGLGPVRSALAKFSNGSAETAELHPHRLRAGPQNQATPGILTLLEGLRQKDPEKHHLLSDFYARLKSRTVLPESQDIRQFAQLIGLKEIVGKSRKDMIPRLMRMLLERPSERLRGDIEGAASVSEHQRKQGYSLLTDKILSGTS
jgi:hypothetical protein